MSAYTSILKTSGALMLLMIALALLIGQTTVFLLFLQEKQGRQKVLAAALHLLIGFLLFVIMLDGYDNVNFESIPRETVQTGWFLYSLPWLVYALLEGLSAGILLLHLRTYRQYKASTVTPDAIRQTVDLLPEGICVSAADGTALLVNLKMDALCRELTGERLSDSRRLWTYLEQAGEEQEGKRLVHTAQEEVWLFAKDSLVIDGSDYERTSAANVTGQYRITEELREKNVHLQEIQRRMKEAAELSGEIFVKQEEAAARTALHNELGQVLLMGRHYLEHPDSTDASVVALMTRQMNSFLLGERKSPEPEAEDDLDQAIRLAGSIGVTVRLKGDPPAESGLRSLLAQAIRECAANTVKHAEGDELTVILSEVSHASGAEGFHRPAPKELIVTFTNNGKPPNGPIAESGGLLSLRRIVEAAGGRMDVQSFPAFSLTLSFPLS